MIVIQELQLTRGIIRSRYGHGRCRSGLSKTGTEVTEPIIVNYMLRSGQALKNSNARGRVWPILYL